MVIGIRLKRYGKIRGIVIKHILTTNTKEVITDVWHLGFLITFFGRHFSKGDALLGIH